MTDVRKFNRLSIQGVNGSIYTDTVVADYGNSNMLLFASVVVNDQMAKELQRSLRKASSIYLDSSRRYLSNHGQKYDFIKRKMQNSDYNHLIISRRDVVDKISDGNDLFDFVVYSKSPEEIPSKVYDKLYEMSPVPMLEEWTTLLMSKMTEYNYMYRVDVNTIYETAQVIAYRIRISKEQLKSLVIDMVKNREVNINNTYDKSDIIDCVDGLDSYLNIFGEILAERIQNSFSPKFDPSVDEFDNYVNNYDDSCYHNGIELYKAQKSTIQAAVKNLEVNDVTFVIGEMGCGKTALGSGISYAHYGKKAGMTNVVMCPSHLVNKWKKEIEKLVPNARAYIVKTIGELIALDTKIRAKVKLEHTYIILSKETAKFSYETRPCAIWSHSKKGFVCPECGKVLTKTIRVGKGRDSYTEEVKLTETDFLKELAYNRTCGNKHNVINKKTGLEEAVRCNTKLWAPLNKEEINPHWTKLGATGWIMFKHVDDIFNRLAQKPKLDKYEGELFTKVTELKNLLDDGEKLKGIKAPRKYSIAKYIRERYSGHIDYFIADELHLYKGNSKQGQAMADIASASSKFIGLTGTLLNGYADGLFYILYRTLPKLMKKEKFEYNSEGEFAREYGVIRKDAKYTFRNGRRQDKISGKEKALPGVSPLVFTKFLLENSVFISLSDMDGGLPEYTEIPMAIDMDDELNEAYSNLEKELRECIGYRGDGGMKAMGAMLQTLSVYPDMPYNQAPVLHPDTMDVLVEPQSLTPGLRNKELALLDLVQRKLEAGEKVLVYYEWTKKTDVAEKLTNMFKENNINTAILTSSVSAETREEWIEKQLEKGVDVVICNPKLVETGLDLLDFTTIVFYQTGYNIFTMRQASRRSWRLSQTKDIEVYFIYYKNTIQDKALSLMATKLQASMAIEGKFSEEGLRAMSNNEDLLTQIANSVVEGIKNTVQVQTFATVERKERERDNTRVRVALKSLLLTLPNIPRLDYLARNSKAIKQQKLSSNKSTFSSILNSSLHVGNLL